MINYLYIILFPGLRIGRILGDENLISTLESVKRGRNIHTSFLDQACFYYYLKSGAFNRYVKNVRKYYKDKYTLVINEVEKNILSDKKEWTFSVLPKEKVVTFWHTYTTAY